MRGALPRHVFAMPRARAIVVAAVAMFALGHTPASAAASASGDVTTSLPLTLPSVPASEKMLVESDQMVYDYDNQTVSAVGNVKIYYGGYTLQAEKVSYNKATGRLVASGNVLLVDPSGAKFASDHIDITDDFRDGFVQSLRVDTPDQTHFTAERAERSGGDTTTFVNGAYTACEPCKEHPEKPPLWNVKAAKIVVDQKEQMVYFTDARIEVLGVPVGWLPYFSAPDPSVKRKSGFLVPNVGYSGQLGASLSMPYFWALAPNYDVTLTPTGFTRQGFLLDAEWRHRLENGQYSIRGAGIYQLDPGAFAGTPGDLRWRGGVRTTGEFAINRDWTFGWDGTLLSDRAFTRNYNVLTDQTSEIVSTAHLTGIHDRNYFEARASYFQILTTEATPGDQYDQARQGFVAPVVDYLRVKDDPWFGGQFTEVTNIQNVMRPSDDPFASGPYFHGTAGDADARDQDDHLGRPDHRSDGPGDHAVRVAARRRVLYRWADQSPPRRQGLTSSNSAFRFMPAVGATWSLPILAVAGNTSHIIEPVAQIIVRPDETGMGALPNNDAQSAVFDTSNLFGYDKFSGYDRVEGGTRANLGIRYHGSFASGATRRGCFRPVLSSSPARIPTRSIPSRMSPPIPVLRRRTPTTSPAWRGIRAPDRRVSARGRFDDATFTLNRGELEATTALGPVTASASYLYLRSNPNVGITTPASVVRTAASVNFAENWRAFGTMTYDIANSAIASDSFGIAFDNECLTASVAYSETRLGYTDLTPTRWLNFRLQLRTFGEASVTSNLSNLN